MYKNVPNSCGHNSSVLVAECVCICVYVLVVAVSEEGILEMVGKLSQRKRIHAYFFGTRD